MQVTPNLQTYNSGLKVALLMWRVCLMLLEKLHDPETSLAGAVSPLFPQKLLVEVEYTPFV